MSNLNRHILHFDMNAFYCACHAADEPEKYAKRPTAVAGSPETRHGVVVTASYEARRLGVRATMTTLEAKRACPDIIFIQPNFELYRTFSKRAFQIVRDYTPQVEVFSIDECWADITGSGQFGTPEQIARQIQKRLYYETKLPCSIGVAPNKFLAKMASDFKKPLGITELWSSDVESKLWPLPVKAMFGIGNSTEERLQRLGIRTIGDLAKMDVVRLSKLFGKRALEIHSHANGLDDVPVSSERDPVKSVGHSITLARDISEFNELSTVLLNLSDQVGRRLRNHKMVGKTIQITIRFSDRKTITRAKTMSRHSNLTEFIYESAQQLLMQHLPEETFVRLLGVAITQLVPEGSEPKHEEIQLSLFDDQDLAVVPTHQNQSGELSVSDEKLKKLTDVSDMLRNKFGENILVRGRMLQPHVSNEIRDFQKRGTSLQKDKLE